MRKNDVSSHRACYNLGIKGGSALKKQLLAIAILILLASGSLAVTWQEAVSLTLKNSNSLKSSERQLESTRFSYYRSYSSFLPQVSANASMAQTDTGSSGATSKSYSYGLSVNQPLFTGLSNYYNLQSAYAQFAYAEASLKKAKADALYQVRLAYIDLLIAQETISLNEKILSRQAENERMIKLRYDSGKEDKGNLLLTSANRADADYNLASARRNLSLARLKLTQLLGSSVTTADGVTEPNSPGASDFTKIMQGSPSYLMAKYQFEQSEISQKATIGEFLPSVSLSGSYRKSGADWPPDSENKSVSISLSYSLFPGGSNIADTFINNYKLGKAQEDHAASVKDLRYSVEQAYLDLVDALEAFNVRKIFTEAAGERFNIAMSKYVNGLTTYDEWNRAQSDDISYQKSALSARKNALYAEAAWLNSYGGSLK